MSHIGKCERCKRVKDTCFSFFSELHNRDLRLCSDCGNVAKEKRSLGLVV